MRVRTAHSFGCLLARLQEPLASKVRALALSIPDDRIFDDEDGELGREDKPHVTVKYGLHTSDTELVASKVSGFPPFPIALGRVSVFHGDGDFVVLKVSVQSRDLKVLNRHISKTLECTDTHPEYHPHVTIAYLVKDPQNPYYYRDYYTDQFDGQVAEVDVVEWSPAEGPKQNIPLEGTDMGLQAAQLRNMAQEIWDVDAG
jgi:2'-5' RNA ligase